MPLMLICTHCNHAAPLPEKAGRYTCSQCGSTTQLEYFTGPNAWRKWQLAQIKSGRVRDAGAVGARVELRPVAAIN